MSTSVNIEAIKQIYSSSYFTDRLILSLIRRISFKQLQCFRRMCFRLTLWDFIRMLNYFRRRDYIRQPLNKPHVHPRDPYMPPCDAMDNLTSYRIEYISQYNVLSTILYQLINERLFWEKNGFTFSFTRQQSCIKLRLCVRKYTEVNSIYRALQSELRLRANASKM